MPELAYFGKNRYKPVVQQIHRFFVTGTITPAHGKHFPGQQVIHGFLCLPVVVFAPPYDIRKKVCQWLNILEVTKYKKQ
jgi:hypothetical protein